MTQFPDLHSKCSAIQSTVVHTVVHTVRHAGTCNMEHGTRCDVKTPSLESLQMAIGPRPVDHMQASSGYLCQVPAMRLQCDSSTVQRHMPVAGHALAV